MALKSFFVCGLMSDLGPNAALASPCTYYRLREVRSSSGPNAVQQRLKENSKKIILGRKVLACL